MNFYDMYEQISAFNNIDSNSCVVEAHGANISKKERYCMFCGKTYPDVKFSKIAHAISETTGNKSVISHFECDCCNKAFGETLENSFGKYIAPFKFVSGIFGKKNALTIKDMPTDKAMSYGSYRAERTTKNLAIDEHGNPSNYIIENSDRKILNEIDGGFSINLPRQSYDSKLIYAALLKMVYSILPLNELQNHHIGIVSLSLFANNEHPFDNELERNKFMDSLPTKGVFVFAPGDNPFDGVNVILYKRTNKATAEYPELVFRLDLHNFSIFIPVLSNSQSGNFKFIVPKIEVEHSIHILDFSVAEEMFTCEFSAQRIDIPKEKYDELAEKLRKNKLLKPL